MDVDAGSSRFIDFLLFRFAKGDVSASEAETVHAWRSAAPENEAHFTELVRLLELTREGVPAAVDVSPPRAADLVEIAEPGKSAVSRPVRRRWAWWAACSFGVAVTLAALIVVKPFSRSSVADPLGFNAQEFTSGTTEAATIHLRDGTIVRLAPQSSLRLTGAPGVREVTLDGRAYFAVAKMAGRPFTVKARGGQAVVLGTRFEVDARGEEMRLLVVEGSVALGSHGDQVRLKKGEMARSVDGTVSAPVQVEDVRSMLDWVGDFLAFQDTPIQEVAKEIEQHFNVRVDVVGKNPEGQTVTASFGEARLEDVLGVVCKVIAAQCSVDGSSARIELGGGAQSESKTP